MSEKHLPDCWLLCRWSDYEIYEIAELPGLRQALEEKRRRPASGWGVVFVLPRVSPYCYSLPGFPAWWDGIERDAAAVTEHLQRLLEAAPGHVRAVRGTAGGAARRLLREHGAGPPPFIAGYPPVRERALSLWRRWKKSSVARFNFACKL